ncbi:DUF4367 domain-containing protein [Desulfoscipio sp. XC116]|uniref:DUF4367 domain-containing protein n=1 Tax=Desulfoscipio sp. XC116 TaxID=3144975 RepID=UPI00325B7CBF
MEQDKVDEVIKTAMEDMKVPPPPPKEFMQRLNKTYHERRKKLILIRIRTFLAAAAVIFLLIIVIGSFIPKDATAVGNVISRLFNVEGNGSINNIIFEFFHGPEKEQDEIREITTLQPVTMSLEEAQEKVPFKILLPLYLPVGFSLDEVTLEEVHDPSYIVTLYYKNSKGESLSIYEENIIGEAGRGYMYDKDDTMIEEVSINGSTATLANLKDKYVRLFWLKQSISIEIFGQTTKEKAIKVAESLK